MPYGMTRMRSPGTLVAWNYRFLQGDGALYLYAAELVVAAPATLVPYTRRLLSRDALRARATQSGQRPQ